MPTRSRPDERPLRLRELLAPRDGSAPARDLGLGDLGKVMRQPSRPPPSLEPSEESPPLPTEWGPLERNDWGGMDETGWGTYTAGLGGGGAARGMK